MRNRACLMCCHFRGVKPPDWVPTYGSEAYDWSDVRKLIKEKKLEQRGRCHLNPTPVDVLTNHECSHFDPISYAMTDYSQFLWGSYSDQENHRLKQQVEDLTRQLKAARQISRGRLQRIEKLTEKNQNAETPGTSDL